MVVKPTQGRTLVLLSGDVDLDLADELDAAFESVLAMYEPVRLDLSGVAFMDSSGLSLVARVVAAEAQLDRRVEVWGASEAVRKLLSMSGLLTTMDVLGQDPDAGPAS